MSGRQCYAKMANRAASCYVVYMSRKSPSKSQRALSTRATILNSFFRLVLERRYDNIRIADLTTAAGIGKATFYEHFPSKDGVLLTSMEPVLLALSTASSGRAARPYVKSMVSHLWERRSMGRIVLNSAAALVIQRRLAQLIQPHVERAGSTDIAPSIKATGIAAAQIAMLRSWLAGEASCTVEGICDQMIDCSKLIG